MPLQPVLLAAPVGLTVIYSIIGLVRSIFGGVAISLGWLVFVAAQVMLFGAQHGVPANLNALFQFAPPATLIAFLVAGSYERLGSVYGAMLRFYTIYCVIYVGLVILAQTKVHLVDLSLITLNDPERGERLYVYSSAAIVVWFHGLASVRDERSLASLALFALAVVVVALSVSRAFAFVLVLISLMFLLRFSRLAIGLIAFTLFALITIYLLYGLVDPTFNPFASLSNDSSGAFRASEFDLARRFISQNFFRGAGIAGTREDLFTVTSGSYFYTSDIGIIGVWFDFGLIGAVLFVLATLAACSTPGAPGLARVRQNTLFLTGCAIGLYDAQSPSIWYGGGTLFAFILAVRLDKWRLVRPSMTIGGDFAPALALRQSPRTLRQLVGGWIAPREDQAFRRDSAPITRRRRPRANPARTDHDH